MQRDGGRSPASCPSRGGEKPEAGRSLPPTPKAEIRAATDACLAAILAVVRAEAVSKGAAPEKLLSIDEGKPYSRESAGRPSTLRSGPAASGRPRLAVVASFRVGDCRTRAEQSGPGERAGWRPGRASCRLWLTHQI